MKIVNAVGHYVIGLAGIGAVAGLMGTGSVPGADGLPIISGIVSALIVAGATKHAATKATGNPAS